MKRVIFFSLLYWGFVSAEFPLIISKVPSDAYADYQTRVANDPTILYPNLFLRGLKSVIELEKKGQVVKAIEALEAMLKEHSGLTYLYGNHCLAYLYFSYQRLLAERGDAIDLSKIIYEEMAYAVPHDYEAYQRLLNHPEDVLKEEKDLNPREKVFQKSMDLLASGERNRWGDIELQEKSLLAKGFFLVQVGGSERALPVFERYVVLFPSGENKDKALYGKSLAHEVNGSYFDATLALQKIIFYYPESSLSSLSHFKLDAYEKIIGVNEQKIDIRPMEKFAELYEEEVKHYNQLLDLKETIIRSLSDEP